MLKIFCGRKKPYSFLRFSLEAHSSTFIVFDSKTMQPAADLIINEAASNSCKINNPWTVYFDTSYGRGNKFLIEWKNLQDWSKSNNPAIKYYSGTVQYSNTFKIDTVLSYMLLKFSEVHDIASVKINGIHCGTVWTNPYQLDISKAVKQGENKIEISVINTWHNKLIGDNLLPANQRVTSTTAPFRLAGKTLLPAGLIGKVTLSFN